MSQSPVERELQREYGSEQRAEAFYRNQMLSKLNSHMQQFIANQTMVFIATANARGDCDSSFRSGLPGFVRVLNDHTLAYPEYRGNGVYASLANIRENPHIGLMFIDFFKHCIGLHVNGQAAIRELPDTRWNLQDDRAERWVLVNVDEAFIHCSKHIPLLTQSPKEIHWGTDDDLYKGGDFFNVKAGK